MVPEQLDIQIQNDEFVFLHKNQFQLRPQTLKDQPKQQILSRQYSRCFITAYWAVMSALDTTPTAGHNTEHWQIGLGQIVRLCWSLQHIPVFPAAGRLSHIARPCLKTPTQTKISKCVHFKRHLIIKKTSFNSGIK